MSAAWMLSSNQKAPVPSNVRRFRYMSRFNDRSLVCRATMAAAVLATCVATAAAQSPRETEIRVLGGPNRFSGPMHDVSELLAMINANRTQIANVLAVAGLDRISTQVLDTLT